MTRWYCTTCGAVVLTRDDDYPEACCEAPLRTQTPYEPEAVDKRTGKRSPAHLYREDVEEWT